jgi:multidrug efflux pump subunit AcrA (membrane-fusion protein)
MDVSGPMLVNTKVRESQVDKLDTKLKARIRVDAFPGQALDGTVAEVAPRPDSSKLAQKFYTTKVSIDRPPPGLRPGMSAEVEVLIAELDDVIDWRDVTLGQSNGKFVEVKRGIYAGELVVAKPEALLSDERKRAMRDQPVLNQPLPR